MFQDPVTQYQVVVQYGNKERARFPKPTMDEALALAESLQRLPAARKVWINTVTIEQSYEWSK